MWRACRLVGTGLRAKGWSRQQALEYLAPNTALSLHEVRTEVDRYIAWPEQARAYKMGELEILELTAGPVANSARALTCVHSMMPCSGNGGAPLPVLEQQIDEYIAAARVAH